MHTNPKKRLIVNLIWLLMPVAAMLISLCVGRYQLSVGEVISTLLDGPGVKSSAAMVVYNTRLPRILLAFLIGAGLSVTGCCFQSIFSNPLASPDTLGVSSGAAFGAALGILISDNPLAPQAMAVFFGLVAIAATFLLSRIRQGSTVLMIVLGGVITSAFFSAGVSALKYLADPLTKLPEITYWLMGSMVASSYQDVLISLCLIALPVAVMFLLRWKLNVLMLPDDEAASLGVKAKSMRWLIILLGTLIIAASVSVCGQIGWVGLVIPHMARRVVGSDHQYSLPASISIGGTYLMLIDTVSRSLTSSELPLSILTAIIGVPIFVMLFFRKGAGAIDT